MRKVHRQYGSLVSPRVENEQFRTVENNPQLENETNTRHSHDRESIYTEKWKNINPGVVRIMFLYQLSTSSPSLNPPIKNRGKVTQRNISTNLALKPHVSNAKPMRLSPRYILTNILNNTIYIYIYIYIYIHTSLTSLKQDSKCKTTRKPDVPIFFPPSSFCCPLLSLATTTYGFDFPHMCRCGCRVLFYPQEWAGGLKNCSNPNLVH